MRQKKQGPRTGIRGQKNEAQTASLYPSRPAPVNGESCLKCAYYRHIPRPIRARAFCAFSGEPFRQEEMQACEFWTAAEVDHD
jgi:hypothetical protein